MDINKIITESISNLINEDKSGFDAAKEAVTKAGGKATGDIQQFVSENPKTSAAMAAALAAGLGAVAFRKKLAALAKKGMPIAKKKTAAVATKIAKKLES